MNSDRHLTARAGVAPGNNETAGKQRSGKVRRGNKCLQTGLVLAAHSAAWTKGTYLRSLYLALYKHPCHQGPERAWLRRFGIVNRQPSSASREFFGLLDTA
ncbi:MAG: transposase [Chloroflexi bacterium]|nr:transposase [Chloroflexota bacterium]MBI5292739.1 transposase [Chloroflexota bacterium]MBI5827944.1 transposase [Chloroflexota bacterium]